MSTSTSLTTLARDIRREHDAAAAAIRSAVDHAIRCGNLLHDAKAQVPHGAWLPWLAENFPASPRTAQGYMRLAATEDAQALAHLGIEGALRQLAEPKPSAERVEELLEDVDDADAIGRADVATKALFADLERRIETADTMPLPEAAAELSGVAREATRLVNTWTSFTVRTEMRMAAAADAIER